MQPNTGPAANFTPAERSIFTAISRPLSFYAKEYRFLLTSSLNCFVHSVTIRLPRLFQNHRSVNHNFMGDVRDQMELRAIVAKAGRKLTKTQDTLPTTKNNRGRGHSHIGTPGSKIRADVDALVSTYVCEAKNMILKIDLFSVPDHERPRHPHTTTCYMHANEIRLCFNQIRNWPSRTKI
ncbi:hypothetical protein DdX_09810 [Ditylenchus destructor]|uniref:Uncharacterized protein n=1 Tax=Ditylenchus destructor TaxID=166010 RepID=A0AAD4R2Y1_9BILA|nr:hypothetical protein DdX_09810 [Ditylenchus destructor]